jgi:hypothetical protein
MEAQLKALLLNDQVTEAWETWRSWNAKQPDPICPSNESPYETGYRPYTFEEFERIVGESFMVLPAEEAAAFLANLLMDHCALYERSELTKQHQLNHAAYLRSIRDCLGVIGIRVHPSPSSCCVFSKAYAGDYRLEDAPQIPPSLCSNEPGCTCWATAIFDSEAATVGPWKKPIRRHPDAGPLIERTLQPITESDIRSLAGLLNSTTGAGIQEADIQASIANAKVYSAFAESSQNDTPASVAPVETQKPRGLWAMLKGLFGF